MPKLVRSANRAFDVLELVCFCGQAMTHSEISKALKIPKSSLSQLLSTLESRGYVAFQAADAVYEPGPAVVKLTANAQASSDLLQVAQNVVDALSKSTRETASFYKLRGTSVERAVVANAQRPLRYWMQVGEKMPIHATSGGKIILANLDAKAQQRILAAVDLSKVTSHTITSRNALKRELDRIAAAGIAYSQEEFEEGVIGISVVVSNKTGAVEGSLGVVLPKARDNAEHRRSIVDALHVAKTRFEAEIARKNK